MSEENLDMSLFSETPDLELSFTPPVEVEETEIEEETSDTTEEVTDETSEEIDTNLNESTSSEEVVEEEETEEEEVDDTVNDSPNLYSSFANVLSEQGLLPSLDLQDKDIKNVDDLTTLLKSEIDSQVKNYLLEKVGEDGFDALEKGISLLEYQQHQDNIQTVNSITEDSLTEDIELAKRVILQDYVNQGIDQTRAARLLKRIVDLGDEAILEDAKESLDSLKTFEEQRLVKVAAQKEKERAARAAQEEKIDNDLKNSIYNSKEYIEGFKVNKSIQDKIYKSITTIVGKSPNGVSENKLMRERRENPIEFDTKLYYLYEITNGFKDFSSLSRKAKTSASKQLEDQLRKTTFEQGGQPTYLDDPESYGGIGSELVL